MEFKDHFSGHASEYAQFRPGYPKDLFRFLSEVTGSHEFAWDCATGNGQAAVEIAAFFKRVVATDASAAQLENARQKENVDYRIAPAESSGLESESADLITVAQAMHWFNREGFFREVDRVLKPGGILAVWAYHFFNVSEQTDPILQYYFSEIVGPYWPPERIHVEDGYAKIEFPFEQVAAPEIEMSVNWSLEELLGYISTWSATKRFINANGYDPLPELRNQLAGVWTGDELKKVTWPLILKVRRKALG
jgi:SAM-dependent methyltransferase